MKKTVAVVFGGRTVEHDISILTGQFIISALEAAGQYEIVPVYVAKDGRWHSDPSLGRVETFKDPEFDKKLGQLKLPTKTVDGELSLGFPKTFGSENKKIDIVFPAMHGTYGEDGSLQGLLRMANVPFVGCDLAASAVAMDKVLCKQVTEGAGVPSVRYLWFTKHDWSKNAAELTKSIQEFTLPVFVKGVHLGSSIGVFRVDSWDQLENQIEVACHYDDKIIVEEGVHNMVEINCAVMGNDEPVTSLLEQPVGSEGLLSFEDKYIGEGAKKQGGGSMSGASDKIKIPAPIDDKLAQKIRDYAVTAYKVVGCTGISRMDFMIDSKTNDVYLTEINTLPGSLQQHLWKASGVSNVDLVNKLIGYAEERHAAKQELTTMFSSSVLNQAGGAKKTS
jgi:D-alanine-D-alanine ligase